MVSQVEIGARVKPVLEVDGLRFRDLDSSGTPDPYEDWRLSPRERADLVARMTHEEKIGLIIINSRTMGISQPDPALTSHDGALDEQYHRIRNGPHSSAGLPYEGTTQQITELGMRHFIMRGTLPGSTVATWVNALNEVAEGTRLGIPVVRADLRVAELDGLRAALAAAHPGIGFTTDYRGADLAVLFLDPRPPATTSTPPGCSTWRCTGRPTSPWPMRDIRATVPQLVVGLNVVLPWLVGNVEPLADALLAGFDTRTEAVFEVVVGAHTPTGRLPLTFPVDAAAVAADDQGRCASPNDVPGWDEETYMDGRPYVDADADADGNRYRLGHGLSRGHRQRQQPATRWHGSRRIARVKDMASTPLELHPDRLLPTDPGVRRLARELYAGVEGLPIISPHGHVPAAWLADDVAFSDPTSLLITPDHYVTRLLHAQGVELSALGVGRGELDEQASRAAFRLLCSHWGVYRGTPVRFWLEAQLAGIFGVTVRPSAETADEIYDQVAACLASPGFRPRALWSTFGLEVLATTDDPCDDLAAHRFLRDDPTWSGRVIPTFRPDRYLEPAGPTWNADVDRLGDVSGQDVDDFAGYLRALEDRRRYFVEHGAVSSDHSHLDARTDVLEPAEAARVYALARKGDITAAEATALRRHLVSEMARMSCDDGLVMTLHPGVSRGHHGPTAETYGTDVGADIPVRLELTQALRPLLSRYGTHPGFQLVLFTLDETTFSREIGPLAGFYPSVYAGAPWWFLDAPEAIRRHRSAVTESAGFAKTSGFIDDTRAFCSIPARHDLSRRVDAGYVATLVAEHRLTDDEAAEVVHDLTVTNPRRAFRL